MVTSIWIEWARALQAISQTGLHFTKDVYDRERYEQVAEIAADMMAKHTTLTKDEVLKLNAAEFGYATPKVDVRGVVFRDENILLVRENADNGLWTLPGGWADVNESPSEATVREIKEESGFDTHIVKLLAVYDREKQGHLPPYPYHVYKLFFLCTITGGAPQTSHEIADVGFFAEEKLPELSLSRVTPEQIQRFFHFRHHLELATDFD